MMEAHLQAGLLHLNGHNTSLSCCSFVLSCILVLGTFLVGTPTTFSAYKTMLTRIDFWRKTLIESSKETNITKLIDNLVQKNI